MSTFTPYIAGASCILKRGDRADRRMTELNELIESDKRTAAAALSLAISRKRDHEPSNPPKAVLNIIGRRTTAIAGSMLHTRKLKFRQQRSSTSPASVKT